jgi:phosphate uptake regulator
LKKKTNQLTKRKKSQQIQVSLPNPMTRIVRMRHHNKRQARKSYEAKCKKEKKMNDETRKKNPILKRTNPKKSLE